MKRLCLFSACLAAILGCTGLSSATHPLFIARPSDSTASVPATPSLAISTNEVLLTLPATTITGCADLAGEYVRDGSKVDIVLRQAPASSNCEQTARPFITRIGPLPPGSYDVTVTLDGRTLISAERATIS